MAIPLSGTFVYTATVPRRSGPDIELRGSSSRRSASLLGPEPRILILKERIGIWANGQEGSGALCASFPTGDALRMLLEEGDRFHVARSGSGGIGISVLREGRLVIALGAVSIVPLGSSITVAPKPDLSGEGDWGGDSATWLEVSIGNETQEIRSRQSTVFGGYDVYIERAWSPGEPGTDECAAISQSGLQLIRDAAMRSAILMATTDLAVTLWNE